MYGYPLKKNRDAAIDNYINTVNSKVHRESPARCASNLSRAERDAIGELQQARNLVIKRADKGSAVVVMNRNDYIAEALRQLNNTDHCTECDTDPTHSFAKEISDTLVKIHNCNGINKDMLNYLIPQDPRTARFYLLPKIHKAGNPGRPIVSGNGSPTERISEFVDSYLNPLVSHIPSYIQDTTDTTGY